MGDKFPRTREQREFLARARSEISPGAGAVVCRATFIPFGLFGRIVSCRRRFSDMTFARAFSRISNYTHAVLPFVQIILKVFFF